MKIFVAGPRVVKKLDTNIEKKLMNIIEKNYTLLVGDATGVDKLIQEFMHRENYNNLIIYASQGKARNNIGNWEVNKVVVEENVKGFDFYAAKDRKMAVDADYGFMIWNGKSKGTLNNMVNITKAEKEILLYYIPHKKFYLIKNLDEVKKIASVNGNEVTAIFDKLNDKNEPLTDKERYKQVSMF